MLGLPHNPELGLPFPNFVGFLPTSLQPLFKIDETIQFLRAEYPDALIDRNSLPTYALKFCIDQFKSRPIPYTPKNELGTVVSLTGCLGMGGAERQLAYTMAGLTREKVKTGSIGGIHLTGTFEIAVRSLKGNPTSNFNLHIAQKENVRTHEVDHDFPVQNIWDLTTNQNIIRLFPYLPAETQEGTSKLVQYFRDTKASVAYLWQDATSVHAALAALIANVPKIVLNFRGLPPSMRPHLFRPEYQELYSSLAATPGTQLICNNKASAERYAEWINIHPDEILVNHNGVNPPVSKQEADDIRIWESFVGDRASTHSVVGSVYNFKIDKRPALWIDFAAAYLEKNPNTLFLLVGDGNLKEEAEKRAKKLGIMDNIKFVGASQNVGYWLEKMDAFVLLSEFEGLPNALIEAQMAGVPVVSTPAGGASDTFIEGQTGYALSCHLTPCLTELCDKVERIVLGNNGFLPRHEIADLAAQRFSIPSMLQRTANILIGNAPQ